MPKNRECVLCVIPTREGGGGCKTLLRAIKSFHPHSLIIINRTIALKYRYITVWRLRIHLSVPPIPNPGDKR